MCEVNARCPNCGYGIDEYETSCMTILGVHRRSYACPCGATVVVAIRAALAAAQPTGKTP